MAEFPRDDDLPGEATSLWLASTIEDDDRQVSTLEDPASVDVAVVGAGIAGLSTALELRERGQSVAVLERDRVASGVTGKTTAKLTSQHGVIYDHLRNAFGPRQASQYARLQEDAIETVERRIDDLGIECGFERVPSYLYSNEPDEIRREVEAARAAGLEASYVTSVPPFERAQAAVKFEDQAWFHPRKYLLAVTDELRADDDALVAERTRVTNIDPGSPCRVRTDGPTVTARRVVVATGFPILDRAGYFARMHPKRSYVLALRLDGRAPEAMYYRSSENYRSVRTHRDAGGEFLLVGGENHKTGQGGSTAERYRRLYRWARERFPVESVAYRWSTQDYVAADKVPLVGPIGPATEHVSVATGFRGWGMTNGVAAGTLLADLLTGESPATADLFDPLRFTPTTSLGTTLTENADAMSQFATDWARALLESDRIPLEPGEGTIVRRNGRPIACARDADDDIHAVSAVCTHMGCLLEWNDAEASWDCPCHGSRYDPDGTVLEGPATDDLSQRQPPRE
ncbi:FAD-dependent oxidoreductase [Salinadaptatus halalkaliphilus]|uniref:FAD-dependent oxidoreductase n=1 Tax=Salinadaptatus halalkaliphilus TaxID=2419781 RepID=A0A4S3TM50_9EURY|nr:FAD-dependent oxidoreductase [Salinadaptatus halalkaliphilus]THE65294.1 FAD-dependent oxidoreductase [Salinadaptatus halalkaliphilus]